MARGVSTRGRGRRCGRHARSARRPWDADDSAVAVLRLVVALAAALALFGVGANFLTEYDAYRDRGVVITARVTDYDEGAYRQPEAVKVAFAVGGERFELWTDEYEAPLQVGSSVDLLVDPQQPTRFQAADWGVSLVGTVLLWVAGAVALLVAGLTVVQMWLKPGRETHSD